MKIGHGLIAVDDDNNVLHFCGYESEPTERDVQSLREELLSDKEFGLTEGQFYILPATAEIIQTVQDWLDRNDEDDVF